MDALKRKVGGFPVGVWLVIGVVGVGLGLLVRRGFGGGGGTVEAVPAGVEPGQVIIRQEAPNQGVLVDAVAAELQPEIGKLTAELAALEKRLGSTSTSKTPSGGGPAPGTTLPQGMPTTSTPKRTVTVSKGVLTVDDSGRIRTVTK